MMDIFVLWVPLSNKTFYIVSEYLDSMHHLPIIYIEVDILYFKNTKSIRTTEQDDCTVKFSLCKQRVTVTDDLKSSGSSSIEGTCLT